MLSRGARGKRRLYPCSSGATYTALSNGRSKIEERLARWLLMAHDRVKRDDLPLTHEFLALMLGVHRPGVTGAIKSLSAAGLISAQTQVAPSA